MEFLAFMFLFGAGVSSTIPASDKPKPKQSDSLKIAEASLMLASTDKNISDDDRQKLDKALKALNQ